MPLPRTQSQRQAHAAHSNTAEPTSPSPALHSSTSAATSPRSTSSTTSSCVSPGSTKSPPSTDYVKSRLKKLQLLHTSPKAAKINVQQAAKLTLSPIPSPVADMRGRLPSIDSTIETVSRSASSSPSVSTSVSLRSHSVADPTSSHAHSPLLAPLPSSLTASPLRPSAHFIPALPTLIAAPTSHLPLPPGQLLPDHLSPRWAELRKGDEEHKESEHDEDRRRKADSPLPTIEHDIHSTPPPTLPAITSTSAASTALHDPLPSSTTALPLQHARSLPPVFEVERETSGSGVNHSARNNPSHDSTQQSVQRSASMPLSPRLTTQPPPPPQPPSPQPQPAQPAAFPSVLIDTTTDWDTVRGRNKSSSVTRIERLVSPHGAGRGAGEGGAGGEMIPEGDEAEGSGNEAGGAGLSVDASSAPESSAADAALTLTSTRGGRHNSIPTSGDYPLSPYSAAQAFDTMAAQNVSSAQPLHLPPPQLPAMHNALHMAQQMAQMGHPYATPLMGGFAPALSANPYAMQSMGYAPLLPGLGMPYAAQTMDPQYQQYLMMQQQQQHQHQHAMMAAAAAQAEQQQRSHSSASFHSSYSPAPFSRLPSQSISYTPQHQSMHYPPAPAPYQPTLLPAYPQPPPTFSQSRLSFATNTNTRSHASSPIPPNYPPQQQQQPPTTSSAVLSDTQARLSFFRDIANNRHADVKEQLERGMTAHCTDRNGNTPLHVACQHGLRRIVKSLLRVGADINAGNREGNTPLHMCYAYHYEELGDYLKSKGANDRKLNMYGMSCYDGIKPTDAFVEAESPAAG